jgi:hypothetical protein
MDDILLNRNDIPILEAVKSSLRKSFSMKDLGETLIGYDDLRLLPRRP